jgi:argininosuccinate lyase
MTEPKQPDSPSSQTAWSGRFSEPVSDLVKRYTASVFFDHRMWRQDIRGLAGARAHAGAPGHHWRRRPRGDRTGHGDDSSAEIEAGGFNWNLDDEDVHLNIEKRLTALVGDAGKRLHTGRSRNDQVATDIRLWLRDTIDVIDRCCAISRSPCSTRRRSTSPRPLPGFTHLQVAQPVTFGHHLLAYFEMLRRDRGRFADCRHRVNRCRWAPPPWPGPPSRSTAKPWPANSASTASAKTRWTRSPTATSPSSFSPAHHW